ncbi:hypothetical protein CBR_g38016 [Chara braunii]|uniref:UTP-monosaccharide-1-phosphate uridylyltransferase n=1 Tax=Chara braunii TaxID=69332 RepID=A0A388K0B5_CHABU|nr:hypothetical protein CBR_g38016 [Chara braunii]|eukprot:GBG63393.1 hypothetical protein CBR_g38016 [Chara braunii]
MADVVDRQGGAELATPAVGDRMQQAVSSEGEKGAEAWPEALRRNTSIFEEWEISLLHMLLAEGQEHLFAHWPSAGHQDADKHRFFKQINTWRPSSLPVSQQIWRMAQHFLTFVETAADYTCRRQVPSGERLQFATEEFIAFEREGVKAAGDAAFVLVAGGLGERLGYSGIKVALPCQTTTGVCFLQLYIESILALQDASRRGSEGSNFVRRIPLVIMTSGDTHWKTEALLKSNRYFGMDEDQVILLKQEKVACLEDNDARMALEPSNMFAIQTKPHGHGDVHRLLYTSGLLPKWKTAGLKWVLFFQDTNGLLFKSIPASLGVSATRGYDVNSMAVPRKAKEAIGGITELTHTDGRRMVINVEYNQLDPLLRATGRPEGDVNDESGFSPFPGNINQLVLKLDSYLEELAKTKGAIAEFVNPKYKDATKQSFKSPTRLECMMQDYPKTLDPTAKVGFTVVDVWLSYSPVKNNAKDAAAKIATGTPPHSATSGEMDVYRSNCRILRQAGVSIEDPAPATFNQQQVEVWPRIVWSPRWALTYADVKEKVPEGGRVSISQRSTLVIDGPDVILEDLHLDGALIIKAVPGAKIRVSGLTVKNSGWDLDPLRCGSGESADCESVPEVLRMRGFQTSKKDHQEVVVERPGEHLVSN